MTADEGETFSPAYSSWRGKPVLILVVFCQFQVPMVCHIIGETAGDVRVRVQPGWEMDVRKDLILAVEELVIAPEDRVN